MTTYIGTATSRIDGRAKVTGEAKYVGEFNAAGLAHASLVASTIAKGRIRRIDASAALAVEGVIDVLTHQNRPPMANNDSAYDDDTAPEGSPYRPLYDDRIWFNFQPVALVVAEDPDIARFAAALVRVEYDEEAHRHRFASSTRQGLCIGAGQEPFGPTKAPRHPRAGSRQRRRAPPRRIFRSDRASQPDGTLCLDGDLRERRQADDL